MVTAAFGAGAGVIRSVIAVTARLQAVERFAALSKAIDRSDNALLKFAKTALQWTAVSFLLSKALALLVAPLALLVGVITSGAALRAFQEWTVAWRNANVTLTLLGITGSRTKARIDELVAAVGRGAAMEIFRSTQAYLALNKLTADWRLTVTDLANRLTSLDRTTLPEHIELLSKIAAGGEGSATALTRLKEIYPELGKEVKTIEQVFKALDLAAPAKGAVTGWEQFQKQTGLLFDRFMQNLGRMTDAAFSFLAALVLAAREIAATIVLVTRPFITVIEAILATVAALVDTIVAALTSKFNEIPGIWKHVVDEVIRKFNDWADNFMPEWLRRFGRFVADQIKEFTEAFAGMWSTIQETAETVINAIPGFFTKVFGFAGDIMAIVRDWALITWTNFWSSKPVEVIKDTIKVWVSNMKDFFTTTIPGFFIDLGKTLYNDYIEPYVVAPFRRGMNFWIDLINTVIRQLNKIKLPKILGGYGINIPEVPSLQSGGIVPGPIGRPQLIMAHGGETVIPAGGGAMPATINIYIGDHKVDTVVLDSLTRIMRRTGTTPNSLLSA